MKISVDRETAWRQIIGVAVRRKATPNQRGWAYATFKQIFKVDAPRGYDPGMAIYPPAPDLGRLIRESDERHRSRQRPSAQRGLPFGKGN